MSSMTVDEKLMLIQKMRSNSQDNSYKMQNRDKIMRGYGEISEEQTEIAATSWFRSFKIRVLLCLLLFALFVTLDRYNIPINGYKAPKVIALLQSPQKFATKEQEKLEVWSEKVVSRFLK